MIKYKRLFSVFIWAIMVSAFAPYASCGTDSPDNTANRIYVVFRYDDYSNWTSTTLESKIIELFATYDASCTFSIIPLSDTLDYTTPGPQNLVPLNSEKADILKRAIESGTIEPAQHGYFHLPVSKRVGSEFLGLPYATQMKMISEGKKALESSIEEEVHVFCPPFNTIDHTTLRVLDDLGFSCLTAASRHGIVNTHAEMRYVPATCEMLQLQKAVKRARTNHADIDIIVIMFHEFDFIEMDAKRGSFIFQDFEAILAWATQQSDLKVATFKEVISVCNADAEMFMANRRVHCVKSLLPGRLWPSDSLIYVDPVSFGILARVWGVVIAYCGTVFLVTLALTVSVGKPLIRRMRFLLLMAKLLFPLALIAFCVLYVAGGWFNTRLLSLGLSVLIAMNVGVIFLIIIPGKRKKTEVAPANEEGVPGNE